MTPPPASAQPPPTLPRLLLLDVNETLSDMSGLVPAFERAGIAAAEVPVWFAGVLRDAFALTALGDRPAFADLAAASLEAAYGGEVVDPVMSAFTGLAPHPDVLPGLQALAGLGVRLATLSNGSAGVARALLADRLAEAGTPALVEAYLSVEDAPAWKPVASAYGYALEVLGVEAHEAMMVAVHPWDLEGARRAGLRTAWLRRDRGRWPGVFGVPEIEADDLTGLVQHLAIAGRRE